tara:strand:- start:197 stop:382 length:186 start_codon:yes stop_codon:yes gene_type:complete
MRSGLFRGLAFGSLFCWMSVADDGGKSGALLFAKHLEHWKSPFFLAFSLAFRVESSEQLSF